jgi:hypothetical protein
MNIDWRIEHWAEFRAGFTRMYSMLLIELLWTKTYKLSSYRVC